MEQILGKFDGPSSPVSRLEAAVLWKAYAKTNGKIEYTKLISHIKNGSTNRRAAIVRKAFDKIRNGQEQIHKDSLFR